MSSDSVVYHKLSKRYAHKKGTKKEPPDALLSAYVRGLTFYTYEGWDAYHYSFVVQTNSGTGYKPIVVHNSTSIGHCYEPIVVRASTNTGRPANLYRLLLPFVNRCG